MEDLQMHSVTESKTDEQLQNDNVEVNQRKCICLSSIIHQNAQSLGNSIDKINQMLQDHCDCKILCLSEHWKSEGQLKSLGINNFNLISAFCREEERQINQL